MILIKILTQDSWISLILRYTVKEKLKGILSITFFFYNLQSKHFYFDISVEKGEKKI